MKWKEKFPMEHAGCLLFKIPLAIKTFHSEKKKSSSLFFSHFASRNRYYLPHGTQAGHIWYNKE
jgi:hypothetical protein